MAEAKEQAEQLRKDYQSLFKSEVGERVLSDLKLNCFYNTTTINESNTQMAFNEGTRYVVLHILNKLELTAKKLKELENDRGQTES